MWIVTPVSIRLPAVESQNNATRLPEKLYSRRNNAEESPRKASYPDVGPYQFKGLNRVRVGMRRLVEQCALILSAADSPRPLKERETRWPNFWIYFNGLRRCLRCP